MRIVLLILFFLPQLVFAKISLGLNWKAEPQFGGFYAASVEGFFKQAGLDVDVLEGGSGTPTIQMLEAKKIDYAIVSADELIVAKDRGASDLVALFASFQDNPQAILLHGENPAKNLKELLSSDSGTLLWQAGLPYALFLKKIYSPIKIKTAPYSGGITLFLKDKNISQQCFATSEPLLVEKEKVAYKVFTVAESGYNPYTTVLATTKDKLKNHRDEVTKMVNAVRLGWKAYLDKPALTRKKISEINKTMTPETLKRSDNLQRKLIIGKAKVLGSMTEERWNSLNSQLKDIGVVKKTMPGSEFFENIP